ncbi:putative zinc finger protein [Paenibacillus sp. BK033]|uniref:anti-sigma factor family protein n=1 Tax=Paenibacillus sp. BK033 TaxID=2512133 RepID=UPI0010451832|nr:zf-HC2 domain-containing protein [Paenibacillus sp. BK033]TCN01542.1 putative zinc finger protein [Paenibacillus sp. BK033]
MTCQEVIEYMNRQLDGDLDEHENEILMNHTRHCPDCAAMFERLKKLSDELGNLPHVMPKYSLVDAILPQLEEIGPFRQPEAAAVEMAPAAVPAQTQQTKRRAKERHQLRFRAITGIIAASVAAGLFLVSYNAGLFPSSSNSFDSDKAETAAADTSSSSFDVQRQFKDVQPYANNANDTGKAHVNTESIDPNDQSASAADPSGNEDYHVTTEKDLGISDSNAGGAAANQGDSSGGGNEPASGNKGASTSEAPSVSLPNPDSKEGGEPNQGIAGFVPAPLEAASPDGSYTAKAVGYLIHIYKTGEEGGESVYDSERRNGQIANLEWSADSKQLTYEIQLESGGMERYVIDLATKTESKAAH